MRRFSVFVFCTIGLLGSCIAVSATAASLTVLNKAQVERAATVALSRRSVQDRIINDLSTATLKNMPAAGRTETATVAIRNSARDAVADPELKQLWTAAVGRAFDNVVNGKNDPLTLDPDAVTTLMRTKLADTNPQVVALLPSTATLDVPLTTRSLPDLRVEAKWVRLLPIIAGGVALASYILAIGISRRRLRTLRRSGWWMFGTGLVLTGIAFAAPRWLIGIVLHTPADIGRAIAGMGWRVWGPPAALAALGLVVGIMAALFTRRAPENRITRTIDPVPDVVEGQPGVDVWDCRV
jgi:hypothetical protein